MGARVGGERSAQARDGEKPDVGGGQRGRSRHHRSEASPAAVVTDVALAAQALLLLWRWHHADGMGSEMHTELVAAFRAVRDAARAELEPVIEELEAKLRDAGKLPRMPEVDRG